MKAPPSRRSPRSITTIERRCAWLRLLLGNAQMCCAIIAIVLLVRTGINPTTVTAVAITCCLTLASRALFHGRQASSGRQ